jgi:hypothetical protein
MRLESDQRQVDDFREMFINVRDWRYQHPEALSHGVEKAVYQFIKDTGLARWTFPDAPSGVRIH